MVFRAYGSEKPYISKSMEANIRLKLDAMKPSYDGSFWSELSPSGRKPWLKGNLPDPVRNGGQPFLQIIKDLDTQNNGKTKINDQYISQILWSTRGRTPHYYKSKPWGMTIPTNKGEQNNSSVILVSNNKAFEYINWKSNRPTHEIKLMASASEQNVGKLIETFAPFNSYILLKRNKQKISATWEIGYQLLNAILQSRALDIPYKAVLLDDTTKQILKDAGISDAAAAVLY